MRLVPGFVGAGHKCAWASLIMLFFKSGYMILCLSVIEKNQPRYNIQMCVPPSAEKPDLENISMKHGETFYKCAWVNLIIHFV